MAAETQYTANTGMAQVSVANSNLDGTGTLATVLTGASYGTLIKSVRIIATGNTSEGMIRLFINDGSNSRLIHEIHVDANTVSGTNPAVEYVWNCDIKLEANYTLRASTQVGETFNIIAEGLNWTYFTSAVRPESTRYTANTSTVVISTANSNRDGTGTLGTVITAGSSATYNGCRVEKLTVAALGTTTTGTVRLFLYDGSNTRMIKEIFIPAVTVAATEPSFKTTIDLGNFNLQANWSIKACTQNAESFAVTAETNDWNYPANTSSTNFTAASCTATTSEEKLHTLTLPPNILTTGDVLRVYANIEGTNSANNKTFRIYVNTADSLSGATLLATATMTTQSNSSFLRLFPVISNTSLRCYGGTTTSVLTQYNNTSGASADTTVPSLSAGLYIIISGQKASSGETATVRWSMFDKDAI